MPTTFSIHPESRYIRIELSGSVQLREIIAVLQNVTADPRFRHGYHLLFDVRSIAQYLSYSETLSLYEFFRSSLLRTFTGKVAVLITMKVQYGITRIAATIFSGWGIRVEAFYTEEEVHRWFAEDPPSDDNG